MGLCGVFEVLELCLYSMPVQCSQPARNQYRCGANDNNRDPRFGVDSETGGWLPGAFGIHPPSIGRQCVAAPSPRRENGFGPHLIQLISAELSSAKRTSRRTPSGWERIVSAYRVIDRSSECAAKDGPRGCGEQKVRGTSPTP